MTPFTAAQVERAVELRLVLDIFGFTLVAVDDGSQLRDDEACVDAGELAFGVNGYRILLLRHGHRALCILTEDALALAALQGETLGLLVGHFRSAARRFADLLLVTQGATS